MRHYQTEEGPQVYFDSELLDNPHVAGIGNMFKAPGILGGNAISVAFIAMRGSCTHRSRGTTRTTSSSHACGGYVTCHTSGSRLEKTYASHRLQPHFSGHFASVMCLHAVPNKAIRASGHLQLTFCGRSRVERQKNNVASVVRSNTLFDARSTTLVPQILNDLLHCRDFRQQRLPYRGSRPT
jgi:hypothetical protein